MDRSSDLRVSDQERERAVAEIREHYAAGRLTDEEMSERAQAAYQARTQEQLRTLRADLPKLPASPAQVQAELSERRRLLQRRLLQETGGGLGLFVLCCVIWLAAGATGQFWPIWVAIFPALGLLRNGWRLYGPAPDLDQVERELERRRRHGERRVQRRHDRRRLGP